MLSNTTSLDHVLEGGGTDLEVVVAANELDHVLEGTDLEVVVAANGLDHVVQGTGGGMVVVGEAAANGLVYTGTN